MSRRALDRWHWACEVAPGRLTGAQRSVLHVIAAHADADGRNAYPAQEAMRVSAGLADTGGARRVLRRLVSMGLIDQERRSGKTTIWTLNLAWTPGRPRSSGTYEGDGEGTSTSPSLQTEARDVGEGEVIDLKNRLASAVVMDPTRRAAS